VCGSSKEKDEENDEESKNTPGYLPRECGPFFFNFAFGFSSLCVLANCEGEEEKEARTIKKKKNLVNHPLCSEPL